MSVPPTLFSTTCWNSSLDLFLSTWRQSWKICLLLTVSSHSRIRITDPVPGHPWTQTSELESHSDGCHAFLEFSLRDSEMTWSNVRWETLISCPLACPEPMLPAHQGQFLWKWHPHVCPAMQNLLHHSDKLGQLIQVLYPPSLECCDNLGEVLIERFSQRCPELPDKLRDKRQAKAVSSLWASAINVHWVSELENRFFSLLAGNIERLQLVLRNGCLVWWMDVGLSEGTWLVWTCIYQEPRCFRSRDGDNVENVSTVVSFPGLLKLETVPHKDPLQDWLPCQMHISGLNFLVAAVPPSEHWAH